MESAQDSIQCPLLSKGSIPVDPAPFVEAVTDHALGEQKKDDCEDDYNQETSNSELRWLSSGNVRHTSRVYHEAGPRVRLPRTDQNCPIRMGILMVELEGEGVLMPRNLQILRSTKTTEKTQIEG
jgi:hypothetical protein